MKKFDRGANEKPRSMKCVQKKKPSFSTILFFSLFLMCVFHQWILFQHMATLPRLYDDSDANRGESHNFLGLPDNLLGKQPHHSSWQATTEASKAMSMPQADFGFPDTIVGPKSFQSTWGVNNDPPNDNVTYIMDAPMENIIQSSNFQLSVAFHLSGCEPKMELIYYNTSHPDSDGHGKRDSSSCCSTKYIFKPAQSPKKALNELLAYYVDQLFHFYRVPPVAPVQIPLSRIIPEITADKISRHQSGLKCAMNFSKKSITHKWVMKNCTMDMLILSSKDDAHRNHHHHRTETEKDQYKRELDVFGTVQLKVPGVKQRGEVVRWVDRLLTASLSPSSPAIQKARSFLRSTLFHEGSISTQRERGTRALFDFLIGNDDRFNNDFVIPQKKEYRPLSDLKKENHHNHRVLVYIDNNRLNGNFDLLAWTRDCRFYQQPVDRLFNVTNPKSVLSDQLNSHHGGLLDQWIYDRHKKGEQPIHFHAMLFFRNLEERIKVVRRRIEECIAKKGYQHVFVD